MNFERITDFLKRIPSIGTDGLIAHGADGEHAWWVKFKIDVEKDYAIYTATRHTVVNGISGTKGIRTFYYLNGKMVKLNYLIAVLTKRQENNK